MRRYIGLAVTLLALGACTTGQKQDAVSRPGATGAQNICAVAYGDPGLDPIRDHIPFDDDRAIKASMDFLSDPARPNSVQLAALRQYDVANRRCWDAWERVGTSTHIQQARVAVNSALAELMNRKVTYGEFNRRRANAITQMQAGLEDDRQRDRYAPYPYGYGPYGYGPYGGSGISIGLGLFRRR